MIRLAFICDIHADVQSLSDALRQISRIGCDLTVCGGDLVDFGMYPEETIGIIRSGNMHCIRGNHDRWLLERLHASPGPGKRAEGWLPSTEAIHFLSALPPSWKSAFEGVRVAVHHGTPTSDMDGVYPDLVKGSDVHRWLDQAESDVLLIGHTHIPFVLTIPGRGIIANPGALFLDTGSAQPLIYDPTAGTFVRGPGAGPGTFGILELPSLRFAVHRGSNGTEIDIDRRTLF